MGKCWGILKTLMTVAVLPPLLIGCGDEFYFLPEASSLGAQRTNGFPGVVLVRSGTETCTGTFVSTRAVLTAAHCVPENSETQVTYVRVDERTRERERIRLGAERILRHGPGVRGDMHDIALIIFAIPAVPPEIPYKIGGAVGQKDFVRAVGFGKGDDGTTAKRSGTNLVFAVNSFIELVSAPRRLLRGAKNRVGAAAGDSGGPLFKTFDNELRIVGTVHGGYEWRGRDVTQYVALGTGLNARWLKRVSDEEILGIEGL